MEYNMIFYDLFCIKVTYFVEIFNNFIKYKHLLSNFRISKSIAQLDNVMFFSVEYLPEDARNKAETCTMLAILLHTYVSKCCAVVAINILRTLNHILCPECKILDIRKILLPVCSNKYLVQPLCNLYLFLPPRHVTRDLTLVILQPNICSPLH